MRSFPALTPQNLFYLNFLFDISTSFNVVCRPAAVAPLITHASASVSRGTMFMACISWKSSLQA